jgi:hypothetical protein
MAINNPAAVVVNNTTYPLLGFSLNMSTYIGEDASQAGLQKMKLAISASLFPYRDTEFGPEILVIPEHLLAQLQIPPIVYPDAVLAAQNGDVDVAELIAGMTAVCQRFLNKRAGLE